jgi:predicted transcriptional regulator
MKADVKRDTLRSTILELLANGKIHYTNLEKKVCALGHSFATTNTFKSQFQYLLQTGHAQRISRGIYKITPKGEKYLALLKS